MDATIAKVAESCLCCVLLILIINTIALQRAWRKLRQLLIQTSLLRNFEFVDKETGISVVGLSKKLFFICPCGFQIEFKGRREKCPKCRSRLDFTPGLRRLVRDMASGIGVLTLPEIDQLISTSNEPKPSSTA